MRTLVFVALCVAAATAAPKSSVRIAGGSVTTIENYPTIAAILVTLDLVNFNHNCGGSILNNRAILTAAHCFDADAVIRYRVRLGSTWTNSGGVVYALSRIIPHPNYNVASFVDSDIAILHTATFITFTNVIQAGLFAGSAYNVPDNQSVWAAGWGSISDGGPWSEQLKHVELWTISRDVCNDRYFGLVNENMICASPRVDNNGQCGGDSGGPLYHNGVVIGVCSFGGICGYINHPSVNVRVNYFIDWIQENA